MQVSKYAHPLRLHLSFPGAGGLEALLGYNNPPPCLCLLCEENHLAAQATVLGFYLFGLVV